MLKKVKEHFEMNKKAAASDGWSFFTKNIELSCVATYQLAAR